MNQYERIVSYIYQYRQEEKGANVGYAKVEKRGETCRISIQMRAVPLKSMPRVYLYQQMEEGIQTIYAGQMVARGSNLLFKASSSAEKLFHSEKTLDQVDGIFIDTADIIYFATSWKKDSFYLGNWKGTSTAVENKPAAVVEKEEHLPETISELPERIEQERENGKEEDSLQKSLSGSEESKREFQKSTSEAEKIQTQKTEEQQRVAEERTITENTQNSKVQADISVAGEERAQAQSEKTVTEMEHDMQMQSICEVCPFKRKVYDYGKKILMTFPSMKPFQAGVAKACVRMELQDIGCLPIASWSLSGNRFLLHGYYCYRHLLFAQMEDGRYVLGVPGIYSEKERKNACRFGFGDFQSIGGFGKQQGAFGYWLLKLPSENQSSSLK